MTLVSVVVPYYEQPEQLALLVAALERQSWPHEQLELVIADDGSAQPPVVRTRLRHHVVRQDDLGFRAAAARNLGVRSAAGEVICFLDSDTIPEPEYVARAAGPVLDDPTTLVVGRRLHRHLTGPRTGESLPEPGWLREGYARTRNLSDTDDTAYRYVISSVLTVGRRLLTLTGGFDESFTSYGGEDWELAWRAWNAGARFVHVPDAVAVHDGPDWAGRVALMETKNAESQRLARLIAHPQARPAGVRYARTEVVADLRGLGNGPDVVVATGELLAYGDITVLLDGVPEALAEDPRVVTELADGVAGSARIWVTLIEAVRLPPAQLTGLADRAMSGAVIEAVWTSGGQCSGSGPAGHPRVVARLQTMRSMALERNWGATPRVEQAAAELPAVEPQVRLEALWGGWG
ncbi:glycosyltransferase family 2 protein [Blastococcus sp. Marseille-P5729]|uniref:glycosyltransferase family 2 protein n=1 Tax=Blastococcus sp. Marseille-P5729 TaxID=2086582 RepID=UPI00131CA6D1|nr:glycosyltransferase [Blastococcus sp. Marseille-P5729]